MDPTLLRQYMSTVYELPTTNGPLRVSLDGEIVADSTALPEILRMPFCIVTGYNPRSMLLPRKVNDARHSVMRDLLILGCYRVESCVGYEEEREEAIAFGRVFRQNTIIVNRNGRPELTVTDPTCDDMGKSYTGNWRVRS
jgi:hypothetical protein